jgi:hypothetical protein
MCVKDVSRMCQECVKNVSRMCQGCVRDVSRMCQECVKDVSRMCQRCVKDVSEMSQRCVKDVSRIRQGCVISYHLSALGGQDLESERCKAQCQSNVSQMSVKCQRKCLESSAKQSSPIVPLVPLLPLPSASVAIPTTRIISIAVSRHHHGVPVRAARSAAAWW